MKHFNKIDTFKTEHGPFKIRTGKKTSIKMTNKI